VGFSEVVLVLLRVEGVVLQLVVNFAEDDLE